MLTRRNFIKFLIGLGTSIITVSMTEWPIKIDSFFPVKGTKNVKTPNTEPQIQPIRINSNLNALDDIKALTGKQMQGREAGTLGEANAAKYITKQMKSLGLEPLGEAGYEQVFTIPAFEKTYSKGRLVFKQGQKGALRAPCVNLIAKIPGKRQADIILVCAHYDHLGTHNSKVFSGANDNASGVGCVLAVIRRFKKEIIKTNANIVIAFWSAEEMGFLGSKAFLQSPTIPLNKIKAVLNVDTVGNGKTGDFTYWSDGNNVAVEALKRAAKDTKAALAAAPKNSHNSDQISFARLGIPAVTIMSREWLVNNHSVKDTPELIKPKQIQKATDIIYQAIKILDNH